MARQAGRDGALYAGVASTTAAAEPIAFIKSWTLDAATDKFDVTAFGDTSKTYVQGLPDAKGAFDGWFDTATQQTYTAASDGDSRRFYLYTGTPSTAGPYFFCTAFLSFSVSNPVDGATSISGEWAAATPLFRVG